MSNLLKFELRKVFRQTSFYIVTAIMVALVLISVLTTKEINDYATETGYKYETSGVEQMVFAISSSDFIVLVGLLIIIYCCSDFSGKTMKCIYSRGFSRLEVYLAKTIVSTIVTTILYFGILLFGFIIGSIFFGNSSVQSANYVGIILSGYCGVLTYMMFAVMLCFVFHKMVAPVIFYWIGPSIVTGILEVISFLYNAQFNKEIALSNYWFGSFTNIFSDLTTKNERFWWIGILAVIYIAVFGFLGYLAERKHEC